MVAGTAIHLSPSTFQSSPTETEHPRRASGFDLFFVRQDKVWAGANVPAPGVSSLLDETESGNLIHLLDRLHAFTSGLPPWPVRLYGFRSYGWEIVDQPIAYGGFDTFILRAGISTGVHRYLGKGLQGVRSDGD